MQALQKRTSLFNSLVQSVIAHHDADFWLQKLTPLWSINQSLARVVKTSCSKRYK